MYPPWGSHDPFWPLNGVKFKKSSGCRLFGPKGVYSSIFKKIYIFVDPLQSRCIVPDMLNTAKNRIFVLYVNCSTQNPINTPYLTTVSSTFSKEGTCITKIWKYRQRRIKKSWNARIIHHMPWLHTIRNLHDDKATFF